MADPRSSGTLVLVDEPPPRFDGENYNIGW
jgi:hypothetical protein